jgi:hypothetical protein
MDSPITFQLQELPDRKALDRMREDAEKTLSEEGSAIARAHWPMLRDAACDCMRVKLGELDPFATLAAAWGTAIEIQALAAKTRSEPGTREPYPLGQHALSAAVHPVLTLHLGPLTFPGLTFTVTLKGQVDCAVLIIGGGRLQSVEALSITPSATLSYGSMEINRLEGDPVVAGRPYVFAGEGLSIPFA